MSDPLCTLDPAHGRGTYGSQIGPLCGDCWHTRTARGVEPQATRDVDGPPLLDALVDPPAGGYDSFWRPPQPDPDDHHEQPIILGDVLHWQQAPLVHCTKARTGTDPRIARYVWQIGRQRKQAATVLGKVTARNIAEALNVPVSKARRMVTARNKGA